MTFVNLLINFRITFWILFYVIFHGAFGSSEQNEELYSSIWLNFSGWKQIFQTCLAVFLLWLLVRFFLQEEKNRHVESECNLLRGNLLEDKSKSTINSFRACMSEHCVRCNKYVELRCRAIQVLNEYYTSHESRQQISRVLNGINDTHNGTKVPPRPVKVLYIADLKSQPLWPADTFQPDVSILEENSATISEEYLTIFKDLQTGKITDWTENTSDCGHWFTYYLYNQGQRIDANADKCPKLLHIIEKQMTNAMLDCVFGNVFISVMLPGTRIEPHYGPCNVRVRCHFGLECPETWILTVDGLTYRWPNCKCILFDDSFLHSVSHVDDTEDSNQGMGLLTKSKNIREMKPFSEQQGYRAVLIVDLWHPDLTVAEKEAISLAFSYSLEHH